MNEQTTLHRNHSSIGGDVPFQYVPPTVELAQRPTGLALLAREDGGSWEVPPPGYTESPGVAEQYSATRLGNTVHINAKGSLRNFNQLVDIRQLPTKIFPPQFGLFVYTPQYVLPALRPFNLTEAFGFPTDADHLVIHDANGPQRVEIKNIDRSVAPFFVSYSPSEGQLIATGLGKTLQEAFDNAVAQLPLYEPDVADGFTVYTTLESGFFRGGIAGFRSYFAKVEAKFTQAGPR